MCPTDGMTVPLLTVQNALGHVRDVESMVTAYLASDPYAVVEHHDVKPGWKLIGIKFQTDLPPEIYLRTADAIGNLRDALDGMVCSLVRAQNPTLSLGQVGFPFAGDKKKFNSERIQLKIRKIFPEARDAINQLKPYGGGNDALYAINELANLKKHRGVFIPMMMGEGIAAFPRDKSLKIGDTDGFPLGAEYLSETDSVVIWAAPITSKVNFEGHISATIAFGQPEVLKMRALVPTLYELCNLVHQIIVAFKSRFIDEG